MADSSNKQQPASTWYAKYPEPQSKGIVLSQQQLLSWHNDDQMQGKFLLIDLRRNDYEGGTISGSLNLPAQSFYGRMPNFFELLAAAKISRVVFYCGSSKGRGTRVAGWFQDYIHSRARGIDASVMSSYVLQGGIKGWALAGPAYVTMMDEYDAQSWRDNYVAQIVNDQYAILRGPEIPGVGSNSGMIYGIFIMIDLDFENVKYQCDCVMGISYYIP